MLLETIQVGTEHNQQLLIVINIDQIAYFEPIPGNGTKVRFVDGTCVNIFTSFERLTELLEICNG